MTVTARTLRAADADLAVQLDACHALSENAYRPGWICTNPPHPARLKMDEIMSRPGRGIVVAHRDGVLAGWLAYNEHAEIVNGNLPPGRLNGEGFYIDDIGQPVLAALIDQIRQESDGRCFHIAWNNPRMWYGLQVTMGLEPSPRFPDRAADVPPDPGA